MAECIEWEGARDRYGYGRVTVVIDGHKYNLAHRLAYFQATGIHPDALDVCHSCDNPPCVNPEHLWLGNAKANAQDMAHKGRTGGGWPLGRGKKLTEDQVREIRRRYIPRGSPGAYGCSARLAEEFGISVAGVSAIGRGKNWKLKEGPEAIRKACGV